jgi:uncharacterized protein (DUF1330 family)
MISAKRRIYSLIAAALFILMNVLPASAQGSGASGHAGKDVMPEKPAYMISSGNVVAPKKMGAYLEAAAPLFKAAGSEEIAFGHIAKDGIKVLEGEWPYPGLVMIIKFPTMDVLTNFWNSPEYQEAKKLRDGVVEPNFTIAIEKAR